MQVSVTTIDVANPETAKQKQINWRDSSDRKWLTNHLHWAMHNNQEVSLAPVDESN